MERYEKQFEDDYAVNDSMDYEMDMGDDYETDDYEGEEVASEYSLGFDAGYDSGYEDGINVISEPVVNLSPEEGIENFFNEDNKEIEEKEEIVDTKYKKIFDEEGKEKIVEADIKSVIDEVIDTNWGGSNDEQMKAVQLLKGLATSDDPKSNKFMKALDKATSSMKKDDF